MQVIWAPGIIIDSGDSAQYPGRLRGMYQGECGTPGMFVAQTQVNLKKLASEAVGRDLLDLITKRHNGIGTTLAGGPKCVTIKNGWGTMTPATCNTLARALNVENAYVTDNKKFHGQTLPMAGAGSSTLILYSVTLNYTSLLKLKTPAFVALGHELIHALHNMSGLKPSNTARDPFTGKYMFEIDEEARTVGAGTYENTRISENAIRREHGLPVREYYNKPGDCLLTPTRPRSG